MIENLVKKRMDFTFFEPVTFFRDEESMQGLLIINKRKGPTSFEVVRRLRTMLNCKRIGHTGTLDPFATGVLVCCLGNGTKIIQFLIDWQKEYLAKIKLGEKTDTYDSFGKIIGKNTQISLTEERIKMAIESFKGEIWQTPPLYSALRHKGKRLYQLARKREKIEIKKRKVRIENLQILKIRLPFVWIKVKCSKGTYIRSLAYDVGEKLGCGAHLFSLCRTKVGHFDLKDSLTLDMIRRIKDEGDFDKIVIPIEKALEQIPALVVSDEFRDKIKQGRRLGMKDIKSKEKDFSKDQRVVLKDNSGRILAIGESMVCSFEISDEQKEVFRYKRVLL